jgi:lipopolysaccharide transport system ATP-binding protein
VLLVDEVLAVGDVEFQEKCIGKMEEVTRTTGRTILFVSHNMAAIQSLCKRSILLEKGKIAKIGPTAEVIDYYLDRMQDLEAVSSYPADESKEASITKISLSNEHGRPAAQIPISEDFEIKVEYQFPHPQGRALLSVLFYSAGELLLLSSESDRAGELTNYEAGRYETTIRVPAYLFNVGHYYMDIALHRPNVEYLDKKDGIGFEIMDIGNIKSMIFRDSTPGKMATVLPYQSRKL